ncbi:lactoylglutathione lyase [Entomobacter blattae]|uniref:lactoylglutathione lyase n=1 Tax=Entomobacter blattae TaxID=2762277 RepID=A0A7H1NSL7_9PROT|nr:lactoylglutathione lyase [Entomobacter blattae]QNT78777.1 Lactoylglutathione lyase [Entomobacter blattae]
MASYLHTMIRVSNLEKSLEFYKALGMKEIRRKEVPAGKYTLVYVGFADNAHGQAEVELTYNWGQDDGYELGTGFGHLAVGVDDIHASVERIRSAGFKVTREPGPVKFGTTMIAFVEDPDGYKVEVIQPD